MQPLLKWLVYVRATWVTECERDWERQHRYCTPAKLAIPGTLETVRIDQ